MSSMACLKPTPSGTVLTVTLQPRAARTELVGLQGEGLKIRVTAPPVEGAANRELAGFLAGLFHVAKGSVAVVRGERSRRKAVLLAGVDLETAERRLRELGVG